MANKGKLVKGNFESVKVNYTEISQLPLAKCREIMNNGNTKYSDDEIIKIRNYLYDLAAFIFEETEKQSAKVISLIEHKIIDNEECNHLRTG
jgi:hypothetical protein